MAFQLGLPDTPKTKICRMGIGTTRLEVDREKPTFLSYGFSLCFVKRKKAKCSKF